jgi:hypothetical protein
MTRFADRTDAGRQLAQRLTAMHLTDPVVLALPRGGVPVAAEIARALHAPMDLLLVRKIGVPWQPELAVAAVIDGERPDVVVDEKIQQATGIAQEYIDRQAGKELEEIERRRRLYLARARRWRCTAAPRSSWTMGSPPGPRCARRCARCAGADRRGWCSQCRWRRPTRSSDCGPRSMTSCAWRSPRRSWRSGRTTSTSINWRMPRSRA